MPNSADINDGQTTAAVLFSPTESCAFSFPLFVFNIFNFQSAVGELFQGSRRKVSVDRDRIRWLKFGSISIIKLGVPTLTRPAPRLLEIVRPVAITPVQHTNATSRVGHKKSGSSISPYLKWLDEAHIMRWTKWGFLSKWELLPVFSSYHCRLLAAIIH